MGLHMRGLVCRVLCIFVVAILEDPVESSLDEVLFEMCKPSNCSGNRLNISYPFYVSGEGRELCGYPGFEITCRETNAMYGQFLVKSICYDNKSIELVSPMDSSCFAPPNFTIPPLNIFTNKSLFGHPKLWFHNCTVPSSFTFPTSHVNCTSNATHNISVSLLNATSYPQVGSCEPFAEIPVELEREFSNRTMKFNYKKLLQKGFRLKWDLLTDEMCTDCEKSGGRCGRSQEGDFLCYCPPPHGTPHHWGRGCNSSSDWIKKKCTDCQKGRGRCGRSGDRDFLCYCRHGTHHPSDCDSGSGKLRAKLKKGALGASISAFGVAMIALSYLRQKRISKQKSMIRGSRKMKKSHEFEVIIKSLVARRYSYADIKRMTNSFKEKLGQGGYGCVYKGNLPNGQLVAVKILSNIRGDGEEFINEVNSISRTSHVNVVNLLGFCFHKTKRALVYEFMANGSLEKLIYEENYNKLGSRHLGWDTLYQISLGIAQGLEYLHQGCNSKILHFDIKPHNILLSESYSPKISDFGLAKICHREESTISLLGPRGTAGFIAPEVFCRNFGRISQKSDVYSFGMTMLEMIGGRKNIVAGAERTSEIYFPHWIHKRLELHEEFGLQNVASEGDREKARKMIIVSLWCVQTDPSVRPTMNEVVDMLRGSVDCLRVPPKPYLSSPSRSSPTSSMSMVV